MVSRLNAAEELRLAPDLRELLERVGNGKQARFAPSGSEERDAGREFLYETCWNGDVRIAGDGGGTRAVWN